MSELNHCVDCCCARSWESLAGEIIAGQSIAENTKRVCEELRALRTRVAELERENSNLKRAGDSNPAMTDHTQMARELTMKINEIVASQWDTYDERDFQTILSALIQTHADGRREEREAAISAVEQEEELPGDIPREMYDTITQGEPSMVAESLRIVVRITKNNIVSRIRAQAKEGA